MRVISGKLKGKNILGYGINGTRPTMDRVKESMFAIIQNYLLDSVVLDLYSGSGNLAIEAISNGALKAYMVDNNKIAIDIIKKNITNMNINNGIVIMGDATNVLNDFIGEEKFDIIFLDPPYDTNQIDKVLTIINNNLNLLNNNAIIVCETELKINYDKYDNLKIVKEKKYGKKTLTILQIK